MEAVEVSEDVYAYVQPDGSWWINNTGFVVGSDGVISIDACATEARTTAYLEIIAGISDQPVRTLVNTHHHGDHTFGNYLFPTATIVGQERSRAALRAWGLPRSAPFWTDVEWGDVVLAPPFLTFEESVTLHVDDLRCEVRHLGLPAHTDNDTIVWLPERRVLFAGDLLFRDVTPFVVQGSVGGMLETLAVIEQLGAETIVPGHGAVSGPEVIDDVVRYLRFVQDVAVAGVAAGLTPLEAALETDLGEFTDLLDRERIVGNLHRAYAEVRGEPWGSPLDAGAALADMVTYNGGRPLSCHA
ncbi:MULTISPECIES: MBL fold metallo-hydrolase [unclassified Nocardioides]|uniref:MBL fold metallo-hydrolase n=1 Tax=unclassified Nocardioides TaxID=2615069 RepID=UPI000AEA9825|nr:MULTISPECIES: MBL fold metallo-hydrolase [unclassified Nocardioides]